MTCLEAVQAGHDPTAIEKHNFTVLLVWLNLRICTSSTFRIFLFSFNVLVSTLSSGNIRLCNVGCQLYGHRFCVLQVILWYVWLWIRSRLRCLCPPERRLITGPFGNHWTRHQSFQKFSSQDTWGTCYVDQQAAKYYPSNNLLCLQMLLSVILVGTCSLLLMLDYGIVLKDPYMGSHICWVGSFLWMDCLCFGACRMWKDTVWIWITTESLMCCLHGTIWVHPKWQNLVSSSSLAWLLPWLESLLLPILLSNGEGTLIWVGWKP